MIAPVQAQLGNFLANPLQAPAFTHKRSHMPSYGVMSAYALLLHVVPLLLLLQVLVVLVQVAIVLLSSSTIICQQESDQTHGSFIVGQDLLVAVPVPKALGVHFALVFLCLAVVVLEHSISEGVHRRLGFAAFVGRHVAWWESVAMRKRMLWLYKINQRTVLLSFVVVLQVSDV